MILVIGLVIVIMVAGLIGTIAVVGKPDEDYGSSTKSNLTRLSLIYILLTIGLVVGVGLYIIL